MGIWSVEHAPRIWKKRGRLRRIDRKQGIFCTRYLAVASREFNHAETTRCYNPLVTVRLYGSRLISPKVGSISRRDICY